MPTECEAVAEWDFLFDVVLPGLGVRPGDTVPSPLPQTPEDGSGGGGDDDGVNGDGAVVLVERGVYVVHVASHMGREYRRRVRQLGEALRVCHTGSGSADGSGNAVLVHLSDEHGTLDDF